MEGDVLTMQDIFLFDFRAGVDELGRFRGQLQPTGLRPFSGTYACRAETAMGRTAYGRVVRDVSASQGWPELGRL